MPSFTETLVAGRRTKLDCDGTFFQLVAATAPFSIDFRQPNSAQQDKYDAIPLGFWFSPDERLTSFDVLSPIDQEITYLVSNGRTGIDRSVLVTVLAQNSVISNQAPFTVTLEPELVLESNAARKRAVFTADPDNTWPIYVGGENVTPENATIILEPGDTWPDTHSAPAAFYAIAASGGQILRRSEG